MMVTVASEGPQLLGSVACELKVVRLARRTT